MNSSSDAKEFYDPETASSSGATHVPSQPSTIPSPRTVPCRDSGLPHKTQNIMGTSGNVLGRLPAREEPTTSQELRPNTTGSTGRRESEMKRESLSTSIPLHHFQSGGGMLNHTGGTYSHCGVIDCPRNPISEMHLEKFLDLWNFKAGKSTSRMKFVQEQPILGSLCTGSKKLRLQSQLMNL